MNQEDKIKNSLQTLFDDYEVPLPPDGWERLEASLNANAKARLIRRNWYIGVAATIAAMVIGAVFLIDTPQPLVETPTMAQQEQTNLPPTERLTIEEDVEQPINPTIKKESVKRAAKKNQLKKESETNLALISKQENIHIETAEASRALPHDIARQSEPRSKTDNEEITLSQEEIDRLIEEFANAGSRNVFDFDDYYHTPTSPKLTLAFNAKGALSGSASTTNSPVALRSGNVESMNEDILFGVSSITGDAPTIITQNIANNTAKLHHSQPVSFGVTVAKTIIDRLSIETGITYTYLHSSTQNSSAQFVRKEKQHLHYLGIPLNFNYTFASLGNFNFFASFGGMIEKDIYGKYHRNSSVHDGKNQLEEIETESINLKHPQFSINGGFGAAYPLYKGLNIYGKLGGAYYFDANNPQYKTIYSDKQFIIDLNLGLRFDF